MKFKKGQLVRTTKKLKDSHILRIVNVSPYAVIFPQDLPIGTLLEIKAFDPLDATYSVAGVNTKGTLQSWVHEDSLTDATVRLRGRRNV